MSKSIYSEKQIIAVYNRHKLMLWRVCYSYLKNTHDTEDVISKTFMQLIDKQPVFDNEEHEKAWLLRCSINICKNELNHWWRKREPLEDHMIENKGVSYEKEVERNEIYDAITKLSNKYKAIIYLKYYEGYSSVEIGKILECPESTVRTRLKKAKSELKKLLGDSYNDI